MPCFKGLAVSIHTPDGPLPEHSVQRQNRLNRITSYIPVPPPKLSADSHVPEPSTFAISITLLTPGQSVPYSTPKPTPEDPYPQPKKVASLPGTTDERGKYSSGVKPYQSMTTSSNETIAAYIYFDGRQKEEVATLLRRGEETWVNSRWVGIPESEGGGLAEREFLFREVGLERWLNGLDLDGKDAAARIEKRRQKINRRRKKHDDDEMDDDGGPKDVLRYGDDKDSPLQDVSDDDEDDSEPDDPPEAAGQIKVALFRVLASGEIKRGEYAPQFDAHDDDDGTENGAAANGKTGGGDGADVDHTTSFAKPKTLDPKTISTQTVTGIDPADKPYASFTFLYRGERQLQKMGILSTKKEEKLSTSAKRKSIPADFSNLSPLKPGGGSGFSKFRENAKSKSKKSGSESEMSEDEDGDEDEIVGKLDDIEPGESPGKYLSPDDARKTGELEEGVRKIKLKRQHSAEPPDRSSERKASRAGEDSTAGSIPSDTLHNSTNTSTSAIEIGESSRANAPISTSLDDVPPEAIVGSPLKKQRASMYGLEDEAVRKRLAAGAGLGSGSGLDSGSGSGSLSEIMASDAKGKGKAISEESIVKKDPAPVGERADVKRERDLDEMEEEL